MFKFQKTGEFFPFEEISFRAIFGLTITIPTLYFLWKVIIYPNYFSPLRVIPGPPKQHWFWGNTKQIYAEEAGSLYIDWTRKFSVNRGPIRIPFALGSDAVLFSRYEALNHFLVEKAYEYPKPGEVNRLFSLVIGDGLLTNEGNTHKQLRRLMSPAFSMNNFSGNVKHFNGTVVKLNSEIARKIDNDSGTATFDIEPLISSAFLDIICKIAFGIDLNSLGDPTNPLAKSYHELVNLQSGKTMQMLFISNTFPPMNSFMHLGKSHKWPRKMPGFMSRLTHLSSISQLNIMIDQLAYQHQFSKDLIAQRKKEIRQLSGDTVKETLAESSDILTLLLRANMLDDVKHKISDEMMCNQITNILGAGHETTASSACWTLWLLAQHQEEQDLLRAECRSLLEIESEPDWYKIKELEYLDGVVKESLRIHPPTPRVARTCPKNTIIDGVVIPKGTMLLSANNVINQDKHIWGEDADLFKPNRWKTENIPKLYDARFSMMTFLAGPHACIGKQMAIMELKAVLLGLIGRFKFEVSSLQPNVTPTCSVTCKIENGLVLKVSKAN